MMLYTITVSALAVLAVVLAPVVVNSASAIPAPKTEEKPQCSDPKFADKASCLFIGTITNY
jgi:hypothetical protein